MKYIKLFYPIMYSIYLVELKLGTRGGSLRIECAASTRPGEYFPIRGHLTECFK